MGDVIEKNIFEPYGPYGKAVLVQLEITREVLIGADVYVTAYEEAIRKWRRKLGELFAIVDSLNFGISPDLTEGLRKMIEEMDQTVKQ